MHIFIWKRRVFYICGKIVLNGDYSLVIIVLYAQKAGRRLKETFRKVKKLIRGRL